MIICIHESIQLWNYMLIFLFWWVVSDRTNSRSSISKKEISVRRDGSIAHGPAKIFTFRELAVATKNFRKDCLLGEGGFGRVYKGHMENGQVCYG
jgi:hypothetical protein